MAIVIELEVKKFDRAKLISAFISELPHHPRLPLRARVDNIARDGSFTLMASLS